MLPFEDTFHTSRWQYESDLPVELMREIFLSACSIDLISEPLPRNKNVIRITPMAIASVNKRWRDIILDLPLVWALIDVNLPVGIEIPNNRLGLALSKLIRLYLSRSLSQPLSIRLRIPPRSPDHLVHRQLLTLVIKHFFIDVLVPHHARWRHLSIDSSRCHSFFELLDVLSLSLPKLETVALSCANSGRYYPQRALGGCGTSSLKHIEFKGGRIPRGVLQELQPRLSRGNIVTFDSINYDRIATGMDVTLLGNADKVVLSNMLLPKSGKYPIDYRPFTATVKTLTTVFGWQVDLGWLNFLVAPKLQAFEITHSFPTSQVTDSLSTILIDLFKRSDITKSLRRLVLRSVVMWPSEVIDVLCSLPSLEELVLHEPATKFTDQFPTFHSQADDIQEEPHMISETLCMRMACDETIGAKLKSMELIWACSDLGVDVVLDMVEERKGILDVRLGTLPFNRFTAADVRRMVMMREHGRDCSVVPP